MIGRWLLVSQENPFFKTSSIILYINLNLYNFKAKITDITGEKFKKGLLPQKQ